MNTAVVPTPKIENDFYDWYARHEAKRREAAAGSHDIVFVGDSITHIFEGDPGFPWSGARVWKEFYGARKALNLGYGWDRTQNVLWRLGNGEFAGQTPRLVVLLIGTNNLAATVNASANTPEEIRDGVEAVCARIHAASAASQILLMGVFPRGPVGDPVRASIGELNVLLDQYARSRAFIRFMDIGQRFLSADGSVSLELLSDGIHPSEAGYRVWAEAIEPVVEERVGPR